MFQQTLELVQKYIKKIFKKKNFSKTKVNKRKDARKIKYKFSNKPL